MEDRTIKIYEGLGHEIYNEFEDKRQVVLKDLVDWLNKRIRCIEYSVLLEK